MKSAIDGGVLPRLERFFSIRNKRAKLPNGDVGNRNRITGASCANLHDLARDDLTNGVVAINQPEQAQSTDKGEPKSFLCCRLKLAVLEQMIDRHPVPQRQKAQCDWN